MTDETTARALIDEHVTWASRDEVRASNLDAEDVVLEFPQGRERIRGKAQVLAFGKVVREGLHISQPWDPPGWRSEWVERIESDEVDPIA